MGDWVDEVLDEMGLDEMENEVEGLEEVGALTEVGAKKLRKAVRRARQSLQSSIGRGLPSPPFGKTKPNTERRSPLGFTEDGTGAGFATVPAGGQSTMRGKVSRAAHPDRLLIVPSAPGLIIQSIKVGDEEQALSANAPVELYSTAALADTVPDDFSPVAPALDFIVTLFNTTLAPITATIGAKAQVKR